MEIHGGRFRQKVRLFACDLRICAQGAFFNEIHEGMLRTDIEEGTAGEVPLRAAKEVLESQARWNDGKKSKEIHVAHQLYIETSFHLGYVFLNNWKEKTKSQIDQTSQCCLFSTASEGKQGPLTQLACHPKKNPARRRSLEERYRVLSRDQEKKRWEKHRSRKWSNMGFRDISGNHILIDFSKENMRSQRSQRFLVDLPAWDRHDEHQRAPQECLSQFAFCPVHLHRYDPNKEQALWSLMIPLWVNIGTPCGFDLNFLVAAHPVAQDILKPRVSQSNGHHIRYDCPTKPDKPIPVSLFLSPCLLMKSMYIS